ncbi:LysR family transcriptional regulator, glycine cleavage system transcriptional activator [Solimonas aquatica]|uniref:LysR family transcriptional regulator, glycine cleavage system transcriptional activator n=1 Tax=Solimonas aquatica TaxID=489703 RepID=A0A1H9LLD0_9GAMM|nr:transcriptional regulator GcvA [Solimonas aquatica]SER12220.1 LysR family transcriptional regulator, glycine cleavage system transcriptional activator [Solimonas aquatica]
MRLPPLNSLRAFEATARHCSVNKAAQELHVTPAAVSHQIKALEEFLGIELFKRLPRRLSLTPAAEACLPKLTAAFAQMAEAVAEAQQFANAGRVLVSAPPALLSKWLIPRLSDFQTRHPEIDLRLSAKQTMIDSLREETGQTVSLLEEADLAIRFGDGDYPGYVTHKLFPSYALPMCSPKLLQGEHPLHTPEDLRYHKLLHYAADDATDAGRPDWAAWLKAAGVRGVNPRRGPTFNHVMLAMQAAEDGLGVVLGIPLMATAQIAAGELVVPFPLSLPIGASYYLIHNQAVEQEAGVKAFRDWILDHARNEPWREPPQAPSTGNAQMVL